MDNDKARMTILRPKINMMIKQDSMMESINKLLNHPQLQQGLKFHHQQQPFTHRYFGLQALTSKTKKNIKYWHHNKWMLHDSLLLSITGVGPSLLLLYKPKQGKPTNRKGPTRWYSSKVQSTKSRRVKAGVSWQLNLSPWWWQAVKTPAYFKKTITIHEINWFVWAES